MVTDVAEATAKSDSDNCPFEQIGRWFELVYKRIYFGPKRIVYY